MSRSIRAHDLENSEYGRVLASEDLAAAFLSNKRGIPRSPHQFNYAKDKLAAGDRARLRWIKSRLRFCSLVATWPRAGVISEAVEITHVEASARSRSL